MTGLEPVTSSLPRKRSTSELHRPATPINTGIHVRAGDEIRTRDIQLGRLTLYQLSYSRIFVLLAKVIKLLETIKWGEQDSNLRSRKTTELQSVPFGRSGISPAISCFIFLFQKNLSRWRDSNPRPADYKSAALAS